MSNFDKVRLSFNSSQKGYLVFENEACRNHCLYALLRESVEMDDLVDPTSGRYPSELGKSFGLVQKDTKDSHDSLNN